MNHVKLTDKKRLQCEHAESLGKAISVAETPLDSVRIIDVWNGRLGEKVVEHSGRSSFNELRKWLITGGGFTLRQYLTQKEFDLVLCRFSRRIFCECGKPYILHKDHVACEDFACKAFFQTGNVWLLRKVWPERISHTRGE